MGWFWTPIVENGPEWIPELLVACVETLWLTAAALLVALVLGLVVALASTSRNRAVRAVLAAYVEVARGLPPLVILFLIYFGLPEVVGGIQLSSFAAAVIGLGLQGGAITGEIIRAGIAAVPRGQSEAARSLGLPGWLVMGRIVGPQALRVALPPLGNYGIGLLKDTSIASIIAAPDLMMRAKDLASSSFMPMQLYVLAAILYFAMSFPLSLAVRRLERSLETGRGR